jgi:signal transduction histidine kinase
VRELVSSSADLMRTVADRREVTLNLELGDSPLVVRCDPDQLQQVFVNLISSSLDSTEEEGGALRIVARPDDDPGSRVYLTFETRGSAVAPVVPARLFDPFSTTKDAYSVRGMNMAVAQWIATDHDGEISFERSDRDSCFFVTLPLAVADSIHQSSR